MPIHTYKDGRMERRPMNNNQGGKEKGLSGSLAFYSSARALEDELGVLSEKYTFYRFNILSRLSTRNFGAVKMHSLALSFS